MNINEDNARSQMARIIFEWFFVYIAFHFKFNANIWKCRERFFPALSCKSAQTTFVYTSNYVFFMTVEIQFLFFAPHFFASESKGTTKSLRRENKQIIIILARGFQIMQINYCICDSIYIDPS